MHDGIHRLGTFKRVLNGMESDECELRSCRGGVAGWNNSWWAGLENAEAQRQGEDDGTQAAVGPVQRCVSGRRFSGLKARASGAMSH